MKIPFIKTSQHGSSAHPMDCANHYNQFIKDALVADHAIDYLDPRGWIHVSAAAPSLPVTPRATDHNASVASAVNSPVIRIVANRSRSRK